MAFKSAAFKTAMSLVLLAAATIPAAAQPTTGDVLLAGLGAQPTVHRFDRSSSATIQYFPALMTSALQGQVPGNANARPYVRDVIVDHDNRTAVALVYDTPKRWLTRFDPVAGTLVGAPLVFPTGASDLNDPYSLRRDQDGGYIVVGRNDHIWKLDAAFNRITSLDLNNAYPNFPLGYDYVVNYQDGHALLYYIYTLYRVDRLTGAVTSLFPNPNFQSFGVTYQLSQEYRSGKILWSTSGGSAATNCTAVWEFDPTTPSVLPQIRVGAPNCPVPNYTTSFASRFDRQSAANPLFFFGGAYFWAGLGQIDLSTPAPTVTLLYPFLGSVTPYSIDIVGSVNLTSKLLAKDRWQLDVSFPGHPGKGFLVVMGLSGIFPGVPVDRRRVNLTPDTITVASVQGRLWPILSGNVGTLDGNGRGAAILNLVPLKGALRGQPLYFAALVFDAQAPSGIAEISDPYLIVPGALY